MPPTGQNKNTYKDKVKLGLERLKNEMRKKGRSG